MKEDNSHKGGGYLLHQERYITAILKMCQTVGTMLFIPMMALTAAHAFSRYVFGRPIPGLVEMSTATLVTAVFLGGAYTALKRGHIVIGILVDRFSERNQAIIDTFNYILCLVITILAAWQAIVQGIYVMERNLIFAILNIPQYPFVLIVGFGWAIFSVAIIILLVHFVSKAVTK